MTNKERALKGTADANTTVTVELVTGPAIRPGDRPADTVLAKWTAQTSRAGAWKLTVPVNEYYTPVGTQYRVTEVASGSPVEGRCVIPAGTSELTYESIVGTVAAPTYPALTMAEGANLVAGTTTGTKIGTATTQKLGFYNATPVVRPSATPVNASDLATAITLLNDIKAKLIALGLIA